MKSLAGRALPRVRSSPVETSYRGQRDDHYRDAAIIQNHPDFCMMATTDCNTANRQSGTSYPKGRHGQPSFIKAH